MTTPTHNAPLSKSDSQFDPTKISRPDPVLLKYFGCVALLTGPAAPFVFLPLFFKYETLKYHFDDAGVTMSWGILFRREIYLTYQRIQDIHLTRNIIQRWMGLATVSIQTASGSSSPEMAIEGLLEANELRDFLYAKMRGAKGDRDGDGLADVSPAAEQDEGLRLLREIRDSLRSLAEKRGVS